MPISDSTMIPSTDLHWIPNEHPFMFLVPLHPPFYGPLFERLALRHGNAPVRRVKRVLYTLDGRLKEDWASLEQNLKAIVFAMVDLYTVPLPKFFQFWPFPKRYGYQLDHPSEEHAQRVAINSRNAFVPLMAAVTLFLLILNDRELSVPGFTWRDRVLKKTGIHHDWLSMLEDSVVGDLSIARYGGIINIPQCQYQSLIPLLVKARLDLYLCWGDIEDRPLRPLQFLLDKGLVPDYHDINHLRGIAKSSPATVPATTPAITPATASAPASAPAPPSAAKTPPTLSNHDNGARVVFPPVDRYSKQRPGESWEAFFARRQESNLQKVAHETPQQFQRRLAREKHAAKHNPPGRRGSNVFKWEDIDGFRVRRAVGYNSYTEYWTHYNRLQRKYDGFRDEWDICTDFGDPSYPNSDDSDTDEELQEFYLNGPKSKNLSVAEGEEVDAGTFPGDDDPLPQDDNPLLHEPLLQDEDPLSQDDTLQLLPDEEYHLDHHEGECSSKADLIRINNIEEDIEPSNDKSLDQDVVPLEVYCETFEDTTYFRFGFSPLGPTDPPSHQIPWILASKVLGSGCWRDYSPSTAFPSIKVQDDICTFLGYLWLSQGISSIPIQLLDIRQKESDLWKGTRKLRVRIEDINGTCYYFLRPWNTVKPESASMELSVTSPATLLEILRHDFGPDLDSVAEFLMNRGVTFNTFIRGDPRSMTEKVNPRYRGLGYRPPKYRPGPIDYQTYVSTRNRFLRTSRCRAALMAGGLVARIAKGLVPYSEVFYGPSDVVFDEGWCLWNGKKSSPGYWDDMLTEHELDLICGVYKVATGIYFHFKMLETHSYIP